MSAAISMSVTDKTIIFPQDTFSYGFLLSAFFFTFTYHHYFSHHNHLYA